MRRDGRKNEPLPRGLGYVTDENLHSSKSKPVPRGRRSDHRESAR